MASSSTMVPLIPRASADLVKFHIDEDYYLCERCATHITSHEKLLKKYAEYDRPFLVLENLINVVPASDHMSNNKTILKSAHCAKCLTNLGFRFISLENPKDEIKEGTFVVFANKLKLWKGKQLLDALNEEPVEQKLNDGVTEEEPVEQKLNDEVTEEPVEQKLNDGVTEEPFEKKLQNLYMTEQLKLLLGVTEVQLLDGVTEEPVEKKLVTEDPVDQK